MGRPAKTPPKPGKDGKLRHKSGRIAVVDDQRKHAPAVGYNPQITAQLIERIKAGDTVDQICSAHGMPDKTSVFRWVADKDEFREAYDIATKARARVRAEQAEQQVNDLLTDTDKDSVYARDVRIRNLLRVAALNDPVRYSEKMLHLHQHSGSIAVEMAFDFGTNHGTSKTIDAEDTDKSDT